MAAKKGKDILLERYNGSGYDAIAGLRTKGLDRSLAPIDVTNSDSEEEREWLPGGGVITHQFQGGGVYLDGADTALLATDFAAKTPVQYRITVPDEAEYEGLWLITNFNWSGSYDSQVDFNLTLQSHLAITRTPIT